MGTDAKVMYAEASHTGQSLSPQCFQALIENSSEMIHTINEQGNILYVSPAVTRVLGYTPKEFASAPVSAYIKPEEMPTAMESLQNLIQIPGSQTSIVQHIKHKDGRWRVMEVTATNFLHIPEIKAIVINSHDISEKKNLEERLKITLDTMAEGCQIIDFNYRYVYVNDTVVKQGKSAKEALLGHTMMERYPDIDKTPMFAKLKECMEKRTTTTMENEFIFPDGSKGWFHLRIEPVAEGAIIFSEDISDRVKAQGELKDSEERFRQMASVIDGVFWMTDSTENAMLYISPGYEKIWGRTTQSLYDNPKQWLDAIYVDDRDRVLAAATTKQVAGTYDEQYRITRPDGTVRWIRDRAFPIKDAAGAVIRISGFAEDITEAKESHEKLEARSRELELTNKAMIGRELKMAELKKENEDLKQQLQAISKR
jgi:PAS domain S-box-containing protein